MPRKGRAARSARPSLEMMEARELLSVTVPGVTATEGLPFQGTVATFSATDVKGTDYKATISWGDGQVTIGTVVPGGDDLSVIGSKTYAVPGTFPVVVTISGDPGSTASGEGMATVDAVAPMALGKTAVAVVGQPFTGAVASFTDSYPGLTQAAYTATIAWADGPTSVGAVRPNGLGGYDVIVSRVFNAPSAGLMPTVTVTRNLDGQQATVTATVVVAAQANVLTGLLDPATDTGAIDGVTAINQPTFLGTASPFAIVTVFARRLDQAQPVALGQAVTNAGGAWTFTVGALPDGAYDLAATETPPGQQPGPLVPLTPGGRIVIDTAPPVATSAQYDPGSGLVTVVLRDQLSGLDPASALNPLNYALTVRGRLRVHPAAVTVAPTAPVRPGDPFGVALRFDGPARNWARRRGAAIALGLVTDLAGNPLATRHLAITAASSSSLAARRFAGRR